MNVQMKQTGPCVDYRIKWSDRTPKSLMLSLPSQIHENFHSNYNLKLHLLSLCLPSAEKRGILGHIWLWSYHWEEARRSDRTATASIFPWDLPASAPCPPWVCDASRLPPILVSPLLTPSYLPCHRLVLFSSLAPRLYPVTWGW